MFPDGITESINLLIKLDAESKFSAILNYSFEILHWEFKTG